MKRGKDRGRNLGKGYQSAPELSIVIQSKKKNCFNVFDVTFWKSKKETQSPKNVDLIILDEKTTTSTTTTTESQNTTKKDGSTSEQQKSDKSYSGGLKDYQGVIIAGVCLLGFSPLVLIFVWWKNRYRLHKSYYTQTCEMKGK